MGGTVKGLLNAIAVIRFGRPVVVVSGLPRSGTSMLMRMLEAGGIDIMTDSQREADEDNPKGYFEVERVKNLAEESDRSWLNDARGKAIKVISYLLLELPRDLRYRVVFMNRDLDEVLASQAKMLKRRGETNEASDERMIELFKSHLLRVRAHLKTAPHLTYIEVGYREVIQDPMAEARRIAAFVGGRLDVRAMAAAVDPSLYRNRKDQPGQSADKVSERGVD